MGWILSPQKIHSSPNSGTCERDLYENKVFADGVKMRSLWWALTHD